MTTNTFSHDSLPPFALPHYPATLLPHYPITLSNRCDGLIQPHGKAIRCQTQWQHLPHPSAHAHFEQRRHVSHEDKRGYGEINSIRICCLSTHPIHPSTHLSICPPTHLPTHLPIHRLLIHPPTHQPTHPPNPPP